MLFNAKDAEDFAKDAEENFRVSSRMDINCIVNGEEQTLHAYPLERLLDVIREQLHLTGTKEGCGEGECGACKVVRNGEVCNSCMLPVAQVEGCEIRTIEGIASDDQL